MSSEQQIAHAVFQRAIRRGELIRAKHCERCGAAQEDPLDGHHGDYLEPLRVEWLCRSCHRKIHARRRKQPAAPTAWLRFHAPESTIRELKRRAIDTGASVTSVMIAAISDFTGIKHPGK